MNLDDSPSGGLGAETIYGTHEDPHVVMSEKVQNLAGSIYQEFERMIARYDEDVVKTLMPLLVNVLECLDAAYQTNQEHDVELELLREDNEQLVTQYEREKGARKQSEQKLLEVEDIAEGERKELTGRLEALESIVRMLELKHKNSLEHGSRLEERENELKKEYAKLHDRYTELFKTHVDYMERTKLLLSATGDRGENRARVGLNPMSSSSGPISFGYACLEAGDSVGVLEASESLGGSPNSASSSPPSPLLGDELAAVTTMERAHQTDPVTQQSQATSPVTPQSNVGRSQTKREQRSANTLYQELSFHDPETNLAEGDEATDITGSWVHPGEYASSGMGKEVENLILENNELLATKNALNVVKDDLIVKVDELVGEQEILREEVATLNMARQRLREHVASLEEELRRIKEEGGRAARAPSADPEEGDVPMAQRKKFTRVEMARVLMERNQYKERFMELQEAVRLTEIIRANRNDSIDKKQGIWNFFNKLFSTGERPTRPLSTQLRPTGGTPTRMRHSRTHADFLETAALHPPSDRTQQRKKIERRDQYRQVRAHVRKEDGRMHAYGWSLPGRAVKAPTPPTGSSSGVPVPVPVFCRPLNEANPGMKFWCGAGVNLAGGPACDLPSLADEMRQLDHSPPLEEGRDSCWSQPQQSNLSSLVWICSSTHSNSTVTVMDANNPAEVLDTFSVCDNHLLCIASVSGVAGEQMSESTEPVTTDAVCPYVQPDATQSEVPIGTVTMVAVSEVTTPTRSNNNNRECPEITDGTDAQNNASSEPQTQEDKPKEAEEALPTKETTAVSGDKPELASTALPTMWLGAQSGMLYIHSAVSNWNVCLGRVQLKDAVLGVVQCGSRVVAALADGTVAVFCRTDDGPWDLSRYHLVTLGGPQHSVRCLASVGSSVWCGHRSKIHVLEPQSLRLLHCLEAHPRRESQVRQLAPLGDGVWVSIRLDSTLRLYHAYTYQHLQDVDIEPYVSKMLGTGKLGFSFVRITALIISSGRLWIGTGNGVIISVPLSEGGAVPATATPTRAHLPGGGAHAGVVPYCSMAHAQLSFHGHRDAVKFFVAVPGAGGGSPSLTPAPMLVMSGGEGYIDFRIEEHADDARDVASHLIVWQILPDT